MTKRIARQARNERENQRIRNDLAECGIANPSARDIKKFKLWEELGQDNLARCCPFSGRPISCAQLLNGEAEIEHILPFKRTLDDSMANLTVAMRWANRLKGNRTPYEAFAANTHARDGIKWETVRTAAERLPPNKAWRFGPNAMVRFEGENDFIARQLTDSAYIARAAVRYLGCLKNVKQIVPNRGGLTALLRGKWRLNEILSEDNSKNRQDHRHHAIDAAVIGLADRSVLKRVSDLTARSADNRVRIIMPELQENIEEAIRRRIPEIVVAYKPDHGWQGAMFKESAYGFVQPERRDSEMPDHNLVVRKPLVELTAQECDCIRDPLIRKQLNDYLATNLNPNERQNKAKLKKALKNFSVDRGIASMRILIKDQTVERVLSAPYKWYKPDSYVCCDVWRSPKRIGGAWRKGAYEWRGVYWSYSDTPSGIPQPETRKPHPAAKLIARLYKDDMIAYEDGDRVQVMRIAGFSTTNNKLDVVPHFAVDPQRNYISINVLGSKGLRKLWVYPDGRVRGLKR